MKYVLILAISALVIGASGCNEVVLPPITGGDEPPAAKLAANARLIDNEPGMAIVSADEDGFNVTMGADSLRPIPGEVFVSFAGDGLLRRVVDVIDQSDGTLRVTTTPADLTDAFEEFTLSGGGWLTPEDAALNAKDGQTAARIGIGLRQSFSGSVGVGNSAELEANVTVNESLYFTLDIRIRRAQLDYAYIAADGGFTMNGDMMLRAGRAGRIGGEKRFTPRSGIYVGTLQLPNPFLVPPVIPVPVQLHVFAGIEGTMPGGAPAIGARASVSGSIKVGAEYSSRQWRAISERNLSYSLVPSSTSSSGFTSTAYFKGRFTTLILGNAGPYIELKAPTIDMTAGRQSNRFYIDSTPGFEAGVGFDVPVINFADVQLNVIDVSGTRQRFWF